MDKPPQEMTPTGETVALTEPIQASASQAEDNWLTWYDNPSKDDLEWLEENHKRDKRVGALLREMHYLEPHAKPPELYGQTDEEHWTSHGFSAPGLDETRVRAELTRRKNASSTAAAKP